MGGGWGIECGTSLCFGEVGIRELGGEGEGSVVIGEKCWRVLCLAACDLVLLHSSLFFDVFLKQS